ncbi:uncharacterized protein LOC144428263 [Styela clava]
MMENRQRKCLVTNLKSLESPLLLQHPKTNNDEKTQACKICGISFARVIDLELHSNIHLVERNFFGEFVQSVSSKYLSEECSRPNDEMQTSTVFSDPTSHTADQHCCDICHRSFSDFSSLKSHKRNHASDKLFSCQICHNSFNLPADLKFHMTENRPQNSYVCGTCGQVFSKSAYLRMHTKTHIHSKVHICSICGKHFSRGYHLKRHLDTHTGEKPYSCELCGKTFTQESGLKMHGSIHSGERPFVCKTCGKAFYRAWHLKRHLDTHMKVNVSNRIQPPSPKSVSYFESMDEDLKPNFLTYVSGNHQTMKEMALEQEPSIEKDVSDVSSSQLDKENLSSQSIFKSPFPHETCKLHENNLELELQSLMKENVEVFKRDDNNNDRPLDLSRGSQFALDSI